MSWASAVRKPAAKSAVKPATQSAPASTYTYKFEPHNVDWDRLVSLDFETYYDTHYTLRKMSTSEYVRDPRFEATMVGIKIGRGKTKIVPKHKIKAELAKINWKTHALLCHNTQFDGLILSHHYGIVPAFYYCSLSMARGLHSNEIGAGLDEVSMFYGGQGKIEGGVENMQGMTFDQLYANKPLWVRSTEYCANDVDEMYRVFREMHKVYPAKEMHLIHMTVRMFCAPVLRVDIPRVQAEYDREVRERKELMLSVIDPRKYDDKITLKTTAERALVGEERDMLIVKRVIGSNDKFVQLLLDVGIPESEIPRKVSPAWIKRSPADKELTMHEKYTYAFAKDDLEFVNLPERVWELFPDLDPEDPGCVIKASALQVRLQHLVDTRLSVKSTTNITRAERFLEAGRDGLPLPVGYAYYRAHTGRWGGNNKMNMQNLTRAQYDANKAHIPGTGELRLSILAAPGHMIAVADSSQIEVRVNAWLWGQIDMLDAFRDKRDIYSEFATDVYKRKITRDDKTERHVGKTAILGLGYQMGAPKLQMTLAKGAGGMRVALPLEQCYAVVNEYRRKFHHIANGWAFCAQIIEQLGNGISGSYKCLHWGIDEADIAFIELPNGMRLKYPELRQARGDNGWDEWSYQSGDMRKKIYGGLLCENLVQALARIIVAEQMVMIDAKYPVVMTTHDECVTHPKAKDAERCYAFMHKCMTTPLPWCPDIPLAAEGGFDVNYSK